jgi:hypothetical protein
MNDIEKAVEHLKRLKNDFPAKGHPILYSNHCERIDLAISALEKQLPKRPHADDNGGCEYYECWIECPDCGEAIPEYTSENETDCYCVGCGQKLDWSDSNG